MERKITVSVAATAGTVDAAGRNGHRVRRRRGHVHVAGLLGRSPLADRRPLGHVGGCPIGLIGGTYNFVREALQAVREGERRLGKHTDGTRSREAGAAAGSSWANLATATGMGVSEMASQSTGVAARIEALSPRGLWWVAVLVSAVVIAAAGGATTLGLATQRLVGGLAAGRAMVVAATMPIVGLWLLGNCDPDDKKRISRAAYSGTPIRMFTAAILAVRWCCWPSVRRRTGWPSCCG